MPLTQNFSTIGLVRYRDYGSANWWWLWLIVFLFIVPMHRCFSFCVCQWLVWLQQRRGNIVFAFIVSRLLAGAFAAPVGSYVQLCWKSLCTAGVYSSWKYTSAVQSHFERGAAYVQMRWKSLRTAGVYSSWPLALHRTTNETRGMHGGWRGWKDLLFRFFLHHWYETFLGQPDNMFAFSVFIVQMSPTIYWFLIVHIYHAFYAVLLLSWAYPQDTWYLHFVRLLCRVLSTIIWTMIASTRRFSWSVSGPC